MSAAPSDISEDIMHTMARFVILLLYDRTSTCTEIDKKRNKLFAKKNNVRLIPPTKAALEERVKGAAYQGGHVYRLVLPPDGKWGAPEADGSWNGMVGMVKRGEADWGLGKFTVTDIRDTVVDYTSPFWYEPALIVMKKPVSDALLLYLGPFQPEVWFCVLLSLPLMTFIIAIVNYAEHHIGETGNSPRLKTLCITCFWLIFGAMFQQGSRWTSRLDATRILVGFWWFFVIVVTATYTGNLIAVLAVPKTVYPVQSLRDLTQQSTYKYGTTAGAAIYTLIGKSTFDVYHTMWQRSMKYDDNNVKNHGEGIERVKKGNYIYLGEMSGVAPLIYDDCQFAVAKETFFPSSFAFVMSENSPYLPAFNKIINNLLETGLIERWRAKYYPRDICSSIRERETSIPDPSTVKDMLGAFVLLSAGIMLATFALAFEAKFGFTHILVFVESFYKHKDTEGESGATVSREEHQHQLHGARDRDDEIVYI
ncbi:Glutamate receptor ionotropic, delta-2 [Lamellibrachia satsuma]|nr:Glutamate receptor ionotropic, delta-2 [Lamellibrachia satsuma]